MKKKIINFIKKNNSLLRLYSFLTCKKEREEIKKYVINIPQDYECQKIDEKIMACDLKFCKLRYIIDTNEYFRYRFYMLSEYGRRQYVGDVESDRFLKGISDKETWTLAKNKYLAYLKLKEYYKREVIKIENKHDFEDFCKFCEKHQNFIVKPLGMYAGIGVHKVHISDTYDIKKAFDDIIANGIVVVEELIEQGEGLAIFHPQSINTIRLITFLLNDKVSILQTSIRMGMGDAEIDSGAISASIDMDNGFISSVGRGSKNQQFYVQHPDTHVVIPGYQIPEWADLIRLSQSLALEFPKQRILGWDFSYSKNGWVVVEVNTQPAIQVLSGNGIGARPVFEFINKKLNY